MLASLRCSRASGAWASGRTTHRRRPPHHIVVYHGLNQGIMGHSLFFLVPTDRLMSELATLQSRPNRERRVTVATYRENCAGSTVDPRYLIKMYRYRYRFTGAAVRVTLVINSILLRHDRTLRTRQACILKCCLYCGACVSLLLSRSIF